MTDGTAVHPEFKRSIQRRNYNVEPPIVIEICKCRPTMQPSYTEVSPGLSRDIRKLALLIAQNSFACAVSVSRPPQAKNKSSQPSLSNLLSRSPNHSNFD